jgi:uncharacterized protein (TIGR02145 family)
MVENLKTTKYNDGKAIPNVTNDVEWTKLTTGAYCNYDNDESNIPTYGRLYNWYSVSTGKLAPTGWHIPTDTEWATLTNYVSAHLGTSLSVVKALATTTDWTTDSTTGNIGCKLTLNNSTGFSALPGGLRVQDDGRFGNLGGFGYWWCAPDLDTTIAWSRNLSYFYGDVSRSDFSKSSGFSVRCVRDSQ